MIFYVGDTHGKIESIQEVEEKAIKAGASLIVQVGDFGIHFARNCKVAKWFENRSGGLNWVTCGGNHDNWPMWREFPEVEIFGGMVRQLAPGCFFADRGTALNLGGKKHLFFGGAESTDKWFRTAGLDWWEDETPTQEEALAFFDSMQNNKPEVIVTHDAPLRVSIDRVNRETSETPRTLENVLKLADHAPARWYFGHHHVKEEWSIEGTTFYCCGLHGDYIVA